MDETLERMEETRSSGPVRNPGSDTEIELTTLSVLFSRFLQGSETETGKGKFTGFEACNGVLVLDKDDDTVKEEAAVIAAAMETRRKIQEKIGAIDRRSHGSKYR